MKVAYYETRQNSRHFLYLVYLNLMHGLLVIKCMMCKGFSTKQTFSRQIANRPELQKKRVGPNLLAQQKGKEALGVLLLDPAWIEGGRGAAVVARSGDGDGRSRGGRRRI